MYNSSQPPKSPKGQRDPKKQRNVNFKESRFDDTGESNALRIRRGSRQGQLDGSGPSSENDDMDERRPPFHRHNDGKSQEALLYTHTKESSLATRRASANTSPSRRPSFGADSLDLDSRFEYSASNEDHNQNRPPTYLSRTSTMRSQSPGMVEKAMRETRRTYKWAAFFLVLSLVSFVVQTETAVYIQHELGWSKAYAMLCVSPTTLWRRDEEEDRY